ncbi:MAG: Trans-aconitate 2-methyltransferase [Acidimicrobiales bacterium]|nr:Trans-aconitate 2-methyltransferase [Acidimicrobiales bacterium]
MAADAWSPDQYLRFQADRHAPAHDLYGLIDPIAGGRAVDLGCGPGELTMLLAERTGAADVLGLDSSPAMLDAAREHERAGVRFALGDLATWGDPADPVDLVAANASLHWVPDHAAVLARWTAALAPGGQLAVQVPANADHASHRLAREVAADPLFAAAFGGPPPPDVVAEHVLPPEAYAELLHALGYVEQHVRLQVYGVVLDQTADVVEWMKGTSLTRFERVLDAGTYRDLVDRYRDALLVELGDQRPYFFAFKRILMWGRRPA